MSSRAVRRLLAATLLSAVVLGACTPAPEPQVAPSPSPSGLDATALNDAMAAVADARRVVAEQVDAELRAAVRVEPLAMALRSPSGIDEALEDVPTVVALLERAAPEDGGPALDRLDAALTVSEDALAATLEDADAGSWQEEFLLAQRDVLAALAAWADASRQVHQVVLDNWDLWAAVVADAAALDENRWRYRTQEEAAGTWEIEVGDALQPLADASAALAPAADARDAAAVEVAAADQEAAAVFAARPSEQPSPASTP